MIAAVCYSIWNHASRATTLSSAANASDAAFGGDRAAAASGLPATPDADACGASALSGPYAASNASTVSKPSDYRWTNALSASDPRSDR